MTENSNNKVVINLDDSTYARSFALNNLVHRREYDLVLGLLDKQIAKINENNEDSNNDSDEPYSYRTYNNSIAILGGRGSGKTSFLKSVLKHYHEKDGKIKVLSLIDPTMLEDSEHVLVLIVSIIDNEINCACQEGDFDPHSKYYEDKRRWREELKKISCGLGMLEGVGNGFKKDVNWQDDNFVMTKGFRAVSASFNLGKNFHHLVETALDILGKKAFMIAFDDVDVDMRRGWKVLESIRKYITTPKILCLISGNIKLYSINVRNQQWAQFKPSMNYEKNADYTARVNELEGQYLLKIFKLENRVHLDSLQEAIRKIDYYVCSTSEHKKNEKSADVNELKDVVDGNYTTKVEIPIGEKYDEIIKHLGINEPSMARHFKNYLLSLSLRSQINLLRSRIIENNSNNIGVSSVEVFLTRMLAYNIPVDVAAQNPNMLVPIISNYLIEQNLLKENYQLIPISRDGSINACVAGFTILLTKFIRSYPFVILDYMLRVAYIRNIVSALTDGNSIKNIAGYVNLRHDGSFKNLIGMSMAYEEGMKLTNMSEHIRLYGLDRVSKAGDSGRIDTVLKGKDLAIQALGMIPLCALKKSYSNNSSTYYSVFLLLATICQILKASNERGEIVRVVKDAQTYRYYPVPTSVADGSDVEVREDEIFNDNNDSHDQSFDALVNLIMKWKDKFQTESEMIVFPPYLLGRIITRFYSSVKNIKMNHLGGQMHMSLICFLNSCLIEEVKNNISADTEGVSIDEINFNNVVSSEKIFIDNLEKIKIPRPERIIGFTILMMKCPLVDAFIDFGKWKGKKFDRESQEAKKARMLYDQYLDKCERIDKMRVILDKVSTNNANNVSKPSFYYGKHTWRETYNALLSRYSNLFEMFKKYDDDLLSKMIDESGLFKNIVTAYMVSKFRVKLMATKR